MTNYHTGFYYTENVKTSLENEIVEYYGLRELEDFDFNPTEERSPYDDADDFRQGSCHLFARVLNETFGYLTYQIRNGYQLHCFCVAEWNNDGKVVPVCTLMCVES